jgi:hypothetical protein
VLLLLLLHCTAEQTTVKMQHEGRRAGETTWCWCCHAGLCRVPDAAMQALALASYSHDVVRWWSSKELALDSYGEPQPATGLQPDCKPAQLLRGTSKLQGGPLSRADTWRWLLPGAPC